MDLGCGMGTIMAEAAAMVRTSAGGEGEREGGGGGRVVLGGDVEPASADRAADNLTAAAAPSCFDVCAWSMEHLPLRSGTQDIVVCDLPFGKAHLNARATSRHGLPRRPQTICSPIHHCRHRRLTWSNGFDSIPIPTLRAQAKLIWERVQGTG